MPGAAPPTPPTAPPPLRPVSNPRLASAPRVAAAAPGLESLRALFLLRPQEGLALLVLCGLFLAAFSAQLLPGVLSADDWTLAGTRDFSGTYRFEVTQGRFLQAALHALLFALGPDPVYAHALLSLAAIPLLAASALVCARVLGLAPRHAFVCALAFADWTHVELWLFRLGPFFLGVAALCGLCAVALLRERPPAGTPAARPLFWPALLLCASLATYQTAFNLAALLLLLAALADLLEEGPAALVRSLWPLFVLAFALALYFALQRLALHLLEAAPDPRSHLLPLSGVAQRAGEASRYFLDLLWRDHWLRPPAVAVLEAGLLCALLLAAVVQSVRERAPSRFWLALPLCALCVLCLSGVALPLGYWNAVFRLGLAHGLLLAGAAALALRFLPRGRRAILALSGVLLFCDAGLAHRAFGEQRRQSTRDLAQATLVLARMQTLPGHTEVHRIAAIGHAPWYDDQLIKGSDLNRSALSVPWSIAPLFSAAADRTFGAASPEENATAEGFCKPSLKWPREGSVTVRGELATICF